MSKRVAWSYSALGAFLTCPRRYYLTKVTKQVSEPPNEAATWGLRVHKAFEERLRDGKPMPDTLQQFEPMAETILKRAEGGKLEAERKMSIDATYVPTSWFDKRTWCRAIADFTIIKGDKAFIGDFKTGKPTPDSGQLRLTGAMLMHHAPWVKSVVSSFIWLKTGGTTNETVMREDIPKVWQEFLPDVRRLEHAMAEQVFPPKPSGLCRAWCPVGKKHCEHCGKD